MPLISFLNQHSLAILVNCLTIVLDQVSCSLCSQSMDREVLAVHKGENCPQRIVTCEYCEFPLPAVDLFEHQVPTLNAFKMKLLVKIFQFKFSICLFL